MKTNNCLFTHNSQPLIFNSKNGFEPMLKKIQKEFKDDILKNRKNQVLSSLRKKKFEADENIFPQSLMKNLSLNTNQLSTQVNEIVNSVQNFIALKSNNSQDSNYSDYKNIFRSLCQLRSALANCQHPTFDSVNQLFIMCTTILSSPFFFDDINYQAVLIFSLASGKFDLNPEVISMEFLFREIIGYFSLAVKEVNMMKANAFIEKLLTCIGNFCCESQEISKIAIRDFPLIFYIKSLLGRSNQKVICLSLWLLNCLVKEFNFEDLNSLDESLVKAVLSAMRGVNGGKVELDEEICSEALYFLAFLSAQLNEKEGRGELLHKIFPEILIFELCNLVFGIFDLLANSNSIYLLPMLSLLGNLATHFSADTIVRIFGEKPYGIGVMDKLKRAFITTTPIPNPFINSNSSNPSIAREMFFLFGELCKKEKGIARVLSEDYEFLAKIEEFTNGKIEFVCKGISNEAINLLKLLSGLNDVEFNFN